jgi:energy-coupling factor transporter ATP-binding protein EcfA2
MSSDSINTRLGFINAYFNLLRDNSIRYCVLRGHNTIHTCADNDVDLIMAPEQLGLASRLFRMIIRERDAVEICNFLMGKNLFLKAVLIDKQSGEFTSVYFHIVAFVTIKTVQWQIGRKFVGKRLWMHDIQTTDVDIEGIRFPIPAIRFQLLIMLGRYAQHKREKYLQQIVELLSNQGIDLPECVGFTGRESIIEGLIGNEISQNRICDLLKCLVKSTVFTSKLSNIKSILVVLWQDLLAFKIKRGRLVFFSGPDGSGKTTANRILSEFLSSKLKVHIINVKHLYPSSMLFSRQSRKLQAKLRGIDVNDSASLERDRGSRVSWRVRRLLGLLFLLLQIWPGYLWARYKNWQGYYVIVDTSFFDVFVKGHRPSFPLLEKIITPLIPTGDRWFVMQADAGQIIKRKSELTIDEINEYYSWLARNVIRTNSKPIYIRSDYGTAFTLQQMITQSNH